MLYTYGVQAKVNFTMQAENKEQADKLALQVTGLLNNGLDAREFLAKVDDGYVTAVRDEPVLEEIYDKAMKQRFCLCSDEEGGEHMLVICTREALRELGFRPVDCEYDDGIPTWQGPIEELGRAYELYAPKEAGPER